VVDIDVLLREPFDDRREVPVCYRLFDRGKEFLASLAPLVQWAQK
jgi:DNA-binding HxlR family transcriptional regulator